MGRALPAADVQWTNSLGGNWSVPGNWSTHTMPGSADAVLITNSGTYTVTLDVDATVASLTLGGASGAQTFSATSRTFNLNGANAINSNGVMAFSSSTVAGAGTLISQGTMRFDNSTINANLVNQGLLVFRGSGNNLGGSFDNQSGATVRLLGDGSFDQAILFHRHRRHQSRAAVFPHPPITRSRSESAMCNGIGLSSSRRFGLEMHSHRYQQGVADEIISAVGGLPGKLRRLR
jgi:hypothetical protein